jgi:hypothetical protein
MGDAAPARDCHPMWTSAPGMVEHSFSSWLAVCVLWPFFSNKFPIAFWLCIGRASHDLR